MSTVNEFLNAFCEETGMDKEAMRASTNRTTAKKIMAEVAKFNGLNPEEISKDTEEKRCYSIRNACGQRVNAVCGFVFIISD